MTDSDDISAGLRAELSEHYVIERKLGQGGMALVYLARDLRHNRWVAVKVLRPELASSVSAERFLREVRTVARLVHPHILPLYDSGEAGGLLYYTMPYLTGDPLSVHLERTGPLPVVDAVRMAREVADALVYAHARGVVHRDVKPGNVLLSGGAHACLSDFGLSSAVQHTVANRRLTATGMVIGSPLYVSPELINGSQEVDGRADVYSLGCMLFEMLTGRPPFDGTTIQAVLRSHLLERPPSFRPIRLDIPEALETLVRRAMEKDVEDRPTAEEILARLGDLSAAAVETPLPPSPPLVLRRSSLQPAVAVLPFANRTGDGSLEYLADGVTEELINSLGKVGGIRVAARTSSFAFKGAEAWPDLTVRDIAERLHVRYLLEGGIGSGGDGLRVRVELIDADDGFQTWADSFERRIDELHTLQEEIVRAVVAALGGKLDGVSGGEILRRSTERSEAYNDYLLGRYHWNRRSGDGFSRAVEHFKRAIERDPHYASAYAGLADVYLAMSHFQVRAPRESVPLAEAAARRALELDPASAEVQTTMAHVQDSYYWDWTAAERGYLRAIQLDSRYVGARIWLGDLLTARGAFEQGLARGRSAVNLEPFAVPVRFQYAAQLYRARHFPAALAELERTAEMAPEYFAAPVFLAFTLAAMGDPVAGVETARQAVAQQGTLPPLLMALGFCQASAGQRDEAHATLAQLEGYASRMYVPAANRSIIYGALGDRDHAFALMRQALEERFGQFIFVGVDPAFDPLRSDPRFAEILSAMRLDDVMQGPAGTLPAVTTSRGEIQ